jgi:hypothetical protein
MDANSLASSTDAVLTWKTPPSGGASLFLQVVTPFFDNIIKKILTA